MIGLPCEEKVIRSLMPVTDSSGAGFHASVQTREEGRREGRAKTENQKKTRKRASTSSLAYLSFIPQLQTGGPGRLLHSGQKSKMNVVSEKSALEVGVLLARSNVGCDLAISTVSDLKLKL